MSILTWYRARHLKKLKGHKPADYPGWDKVKRVALYFEGAHLPKGEPKAWLSFLEEQGCEVSILSYQHMKRKELHPAWDYPSLCKDDKNWWGWPDSADWSDFRQHNYDVLIDLSQSDNDWHQIVSMHCNASMKVAFQKNKSAWSDLIVACEKGGFSDACRKEVLALLKFINAA